MRIVLILNSPNWSGASHYCTLLGRQLIRQGHEVLLLTEPGKPLAKARQFGIPCDDTIRLNHRNPGLYVHAMKRMKTIFRAFRPDIISAHINEGAWMAGLMARWFAPQAAVVRARTDIDPPKSHFINRYVHHAWTDHLMVSSLLHKRLCHNLLDFPAEAIDVVYGPVDTEEFRPGIDPARSFRREVGIGDDERTVLIGMVARLDPVKGHEYALEAFSLLDRRLPVRLALLGYENERTFAWLRQTAERFGVADRIATFGYRDDLPAVIDAFDLGLIASIGSEANCRIALECLATGKPVVATSVGVIPEIIQDGEEGFIVPPRDPVAMGRALTRLIQDPGLRHRLGRQGRAKTVAHFTLEVFGRQVERVYQKALQRKRSAAST
ncbi:MAG: glycosyl transferase, group 1 [Candidatus Ozemobacter sibiricus]|jgi:glycosyltransferase involved in cell wall biosynthesis|uniref:Glycosyl transferase, group 1 n=1 Tax=Candidatus Ozemobacter sibiricus TaxID=2268124 RepID=A0A367ZIA4_9BACT|nr:MAG: glycosyl transferase, group 1 [Candidatus Ozemobacter sibiricus]